MHVHTTPPRQGHFPECPCSVGYVVGIGVCLRKGHVIFLFTGLRCDLSISLGPGPFGPSPSLCVSCGPVAPGLDPVPAAAAASFQLPLLDMGGGAGLCSLHSTPFQEDFSWN